MKAQQVRPAVEVLLWVEVLCVAVVGVLSIVNPPRDSWLSAGLGVLFVGWVVPGATAAVMLARGAGRTSGTAEQTVLRIVAGVGLFPLVLALLFTASGCLN